MAAGLGFKEFTTGDVLTAADANGYLASQVVMVFADAADRTADLTSPQEGMISYLKDTNAVEKYDGAAWVSVSSGGGGKLLQLVSASTTTSTTINTTTNTDTGLTATITPTLSTSKILVMVSSSLFISRNSSGLFIGGRILRGGTTILDQQASNISGMTTAVVNNLEIQDNVSLSVLDAPATTSATTYKLQVRHHFGGSITAQPAGSMSTITLFEIGA
jgi:hypothetical protein